MFGLHVKKCLVYILVKRFYEVKFISYFTISPQWRYLKCGNIIANFNAQPVSRTKVWSKRIRNFGWAHFIFYTLINPLQGFTFWDSFGIFFSKFPPHVNNVSLGWRNSMWLKRVLWLEMCSANTVLTGNNSLTHLIRFEKPKLNFERVLHLGRWTSPRTFSKMRK